MATKGGQIGNQNARRSHTRLAVSFDGSLVDIILKRMERMGYDNPTDKEIKDFIRDIVKAEIATS